MTPRVVATDLDGTLLRTDGSVSPRSRAALAAAEDAGAMVVIVTGRPPRWLSGIATETGHRGVAIAANGALVWDLHSERVIAAYPFDAAAVTAVANRLRDAIPGLTFGVETVADGFGHEPGYRPRWATGDGALVAELDELLTRPVAKLLARHEEMSADELLDLAAGAVDAEVAVLTHSSRDGLLEISAAGITKASTLAAMCAERRLDAADVVAFGDMPNDVPMLTWAGLGVAVANAHPTVIEAADEVAASNDEDGVAEVLERWFVS